MNSTRPTNSDGCASLFENVAGYGYSTVELPWTREKSSYPDTPQALVPFRFAQSLTSSFHGKRTPTFNTPTPCPPRNAVPVHPPRCPRRVCWVTGVGPWISRFLDVWASFSTESQLRFRPDPLLTASPPLTRQPSAISGFPPSPGLRY